MELHDSAAQRQLVALVLAGEEIDEFRSTCLDGARRVLVRWDDGIAKRGKRLVLMSGEELAPVCSGGVVGPLLGDHFMHTRGRLHKHGPPYVPCRLSHCAP